MYYLDKELNVVPQNEAVFIGKAYEYKGYLRLDCFLTTTGKMVVTASVKDSTLGTLHDLFRTYHDDMSIESEGNYFENDMDGVWKYWDKKGFITDSVIYKRGVRIAYGAYKYFFYKPTTKQLLVSPELKDTLAWRSYSFTDSLKNTFTQQEVSIKDGKERINFEADFIGDRGLLKDYDSTGVVKADSVFSRKLEEASFIGGDQAWRDFLRKNLNANVPAENYAPDGKYTVIIKFIINPDGTLSDIKAENDPGYGMVKEAIRVIKKAAKKWQPANKYGTYVKAYRRQPITFLIQRSVR
jgi:hypothetical protein